MTITSVRDAIVNDVFLPAWQADPVTAAVPVLFDDVRGDKPGFDADGYPIPFARITVQHQSGGSNTISVQAGKDEYVGQVVVQCFGPKGEGHTEADQLAEVAKKAFRRKFIPNHDGWFFNVAPREVPNQGAHDQINLDASFRYFERVA